MKNLRGKTQYFLHFDKNIMGHICGNGKENLVLRK